MISAFYEHAVDWGDCQFTPCKAFVKGPRFMNMVMTFVLHPLSHYNSITERRARFLLALLEYLTIDFPLHFILSILDVYRDTATHDRLIFPLVIMQILCHFSVPFLLSIIFLSCVPKTMLSLNIVRCSLGHGSRIQQLFPPVQLHLILFHHHLLLSLLQAM